MSRSSWAVTAALFSVSGCGGGGDGLEPQAGDAATVAPGPTAESGPGPQLLAVATAACPAPAWVSGQQYAAGAVVDYQGSLYRAVYANPGYIPTVSTYFWAPAPCSPPPAPAACVFADWVAGLFYPAGSIVSYAGGTYRAKFDNPGYTPTVSTYFWEPYACTPAPPPAPTPAPPAPTPAPAPACVFPGWVSGTPYKTGAIVTYQGKLYIAKFDNPGYIPNVSTYFWAPYVCTAAPAPAPSPNPAPETTTGRWGPAFIIPQVGMHAAVLHTGKVLFWSYDPANNFDPALSANSSNYLWDPATRTGRALPTPSMLWCGGQTLLADGRVLSIGGTASYPTATSGYKGANAAFTFNPVTETWAAVYGTAAIPRWYPTLTRMADNKVVVRSGFDDAGTNTITAATEVFTPSADPAGVGTFELKGYRESTGLYPQQWLLPSGLFLEAGPDRFSSATYNHVTNFWSNLPPMIDYHPNYSNKTAYTDLSVTPAKQVVMMAGGQIGTTAIARNEYLDGFNPATGWRSFPSWNVARYNANTVLLADGSMVTVGGNSGLNNYDNPVFTTELYSSNAGNLSGRWSTVGSHAIEAAYHSSAILLPDATVLLMQDDLDKSVVASAQHKAQVYSPPYLFKGPQPVITAAPATAALGSTIAVTTDRTGMTSALLVAPAAVTHGNNMTQQAIKLKVVPRANGLDVSMPTSAALTPPGYYMLFVLDSLGVPSVAKFIKIG